MNLTKYIEEYGTEGLYLEELEYKYDVTELCPHGWIIIHKPKDSIIVDFAVAEFYSSRTEPTSETEVDILFYGAGPSGSLRECRHTYWGENGEGYLFYPSLEIITKGLEYLTKYFDMN